MTSWKLFSKGRAGISNQHPTGTKYNNILPSQEHLHSQTAIKGHPARSIPPHLHFCSHSPTKVTTQMAAEGYLSTQEATMRKNSYWLSSLILCPLRDQLGSAPTIIQSSASIKDTKGCALYCLSLLQNLPGKEHPVRSGHLQPLARMQSLRKKCNRLLLQHCSGRGERLPVPIWLLFPRLGDRSLIRLLLPLTRLFLPVVQLEGPNTLGPFPTASATSR